jgi:hypothetical protein
MMPEPVQKSLAWLRPVLSVVTTSCISLLAYAVVYNLGRPRNPHPDPALAIRLIPLEVLLGLLAGVMVFRSFEHRQWIEPRPDTQERMVTRLALRRGGPFTLTEVIKSSPLNDEQAREALSRLMESARLAYEDSTYRLLPHG